MAKHKGKPRGMNYAAVIQRDRMVKAAVEKAAVDETVELRTNINTQRMTWLMVCSVADAFGIGQKRIQQFFEAFQKNIDEYDRMMTEVDAEYANEKLRQRAEQVSGMDIAYLYEAEIRLAKARNEAKGVFFDKKPEKGPEVL